MGIMQASLAGWHLGMTDAVEGDLPYEKGEPMNSALLIKNYNPNIVLQSLVLRNGRRLLHHDKPDTLDTTQILYSDKYPVNQYILDLSMSNFNGGLLGVGMLETTRPTYFKSPILFIKDIINGKTVTNIVSAIVEQTPNYPVFKWHDIWNLEKEVGNFLDKGIRIQGEMSDWYGYANLVVLTTTKSKREYNGTKVYPVYVYAYDDRSRYLKYDFMPYDVQTNDIDATWRVRKPSQYLLNEGSVRQLNIMNHPPIFYPITYKKEAGRKIYQDHWYYPFEESPQLPLSKYSNWQGDNIVPYTASMIAGVEIPSFNDKLLNNSPMKLFNKNYDLSSKIDIVFWQTDQMPMHQRDKDSYPLTFKQEQITIVDEEYTNILIDDELDVNFLGRRNRFPMEKEDFIMSVEPLRLNMELYTKIDQVHEPISNDNTIDVNNITNYYKPLAMVPCTIQYQDTEEKINTMLSFPMDHAQSGFVTILPQDALEYKSKIPNANEPCWTYCLPKYVTKELPRYWLPDEKIPYVLTAVIGGIEVEVKRDVYIVPKSYEFPKLTNIQYYYLAKDENKNYYVSVKPNSLTRGNPNTIVYFQNTKVLGTPYSTDLKKINYHIDDSDIRDLEHRPYLVYSRNPFTMFTLRLNFDSLETVLDELPSELTEFKLYISASDDSIGLVKRDVYGIIHSPATDGYSSPQVKTSKDNQYRLVKRFIVRGEEGIKSLGDKWNIFQRTNQGSETFLGTNNWSKKLDYNDVSEFNSLTNKEDKGIWAIPGDAATTDYLNLRNIENSGIEWTPDFYLWDYGLTGDILSDNLVSTGEEQIWKGTGARLLTVTRGATVIAGCQTEYYEEEEGIVRVSLVQNGKISNDIFPEINKLYVGRAYFTAIANFREQIILFSSTSIYRIVLNDLSDASSWEVFDAIDGQGTFDQKSIAVTPYGVVFANGNGIWYTDGSQINNISKAVQNNYKYSIGNSNLHSVSYLFNELSIGDNVQVVYESLSNEVHTVLNSNNKTIHWIYNFEFQNWRINEIKTDYKAQQSDLTTKVGKVSSKHKTLYDEPKKGIIRAFTAIVPTVTNRLGNLINNKPNSTIVVWDSLGNQDFDYIPVNSNGLFRDTMREPITGVIVSHDIGDGINDSLLEMVEIEGYPIPSSATQVGQTEIYDANNPDPQLVIAPRHISNATYGVMNVWNRDIIKLNLKDQWNKWRHRTSPTTKAPSTNGYNSNRESFIYRTPFGLSFRKSVVMFKSYSISMIRTLQLTVRTVKRKIYS